MFIFVYVLKLIRLISFLNIGVRLMVFNATFNNISLISWRSVFYWWRKQECPSCRKSLKNFSTQCCIEPVHLAISGIRTYNFSLVLIAQVVVNPTTIRPRPRRPLILNIKSTIMVQDVVQNFGSLQKLTRYFFIIIQSLSTCFRNSF
jgi:hypothetical protein